METLSIGEVEKDLRRGLRVKVDHVIFRDYKWQPHLEVKISIESLRKQPVRVSSADLALWYNQQEVGPIPPLTRPYEITEPDEPVEIRMRKELYPTLAEELRNKPQNEGHFQIRGMIIVESPYHLGFIEFPVDITYSAK